MRLLPRLGPGAEGLRDEGAVAELEELAEAAAALGIVQGLVEVSAAGEVGQGLHLVVEEEGVAKAHHVEALGSDLKVDLHGLGGVHGYALDYGKAAVDKLLVGHDLIDQTDAESFMGVDVIAGEGVTQGVLVPRR